MQVAREHFEAGRLQEAVQAMNDEVKKHPTDADRRVFLGELLCLAGNLERADLQFDVVGEREPKLAVGVSLIRQLIRGEQARRQFFAEGRVPELIGEPPDHLRLALQASTSIRAGNAAEALALLAEAEEKRPSLSGTCNGKSFDEFRDLDDLTAGFFEVITSNGKYYAIPTERIISIDYRRPERPRDLIWRRAEMMVRDGPEGEVFLPAIYTPFGSEDDSARLGRSTDWVGGGPVRGVGQRTYLVGEASMPAMELERVEFTTAAA
jgi:type VI secretion system protein ImpE